jgi:hypothetical protein
MAMRDSLNVHDGKVTLRTEEGRVFRRPESELLEMFRRELVPPLGGQAQPDGVRFVEWRDPFLMIVHESPPRVRPLRWANDEGGSGGYRKVLLGLPFTVSFVTFYRQGEGLDVAFFNELYFARQSLRSRDDPLCFPALLSVPRLRMTDRDAAPVCTAHMSRPKSSDWVGLLRNFLHHLWNGKFEPDAGNLPFNLGPSWYTLSREAHPDLYTVARWEEASRRNPLFGLGVPWLPAQARVGAVMDSIFEIQFANRAGQPHNPGWHAGTSIRPRGVVRRFLHHVQRFDEGGSRD